MKWLENKIVVHLLLIVFFPIGLYALWKNSTIAKWWKITATIIVALAFFNWIGRNKQAQAPASSNEIVKPSLTPSQQDSIAKAENLAQIENQKQNTVSAEDLFATYQANEVKADANLKDKNFYVFGKVADIRKDAFNNIIVDLATSNQFMPIHCYVEDEQAASQLNKGQKVTVFGSCQGSTLGQVVMKDCKFVDNL